MAQLTDDCFAFSGPLLPVEEVERIIDGCGAHVDESANKNLEPTP